jgi:ATP-dependent protease Clp ATPase subunit
MGESSKAACSLCDKSMPEVRKLIATHTTDATLIYLCDECLGVMVDILEEDLGSDWNRSGRS